MINFAKRVKQRLAGQSGSSSSDAAYLRAQAALMLQEVINHGGSLRKNLKEKANKFPSMEDQSLFKELCFGTIRWYFQLDSITSQLLNKPLPAKHSDIRLLICIGLYQLIALRIPTYASVNETVSAVKLLNKPWATKLVNKLLRQFLRKKQILLQHFPNDQARYAHPQWLIDTLQADWPENWETILNANNQRPPFTLRINRNKTSPIGYVALLEKQHIESRAPSDFPDAVIVNTALPTEQLPGFTQGLCSVQDLSGQMVVRVLDLAPDQHILDACAAPGSKSSHILEAEPNIGKLVAIDIDAERLLRVKENIQRLQLPQDVVKLVLDDASHTKQWWDGKPFDRILLDAPCSATGVIRRHPDIKILRCATDIEQSSQLQQLLLKSLWPLLAPKGKLLYTTCSLSRRENDKVIHQFLSATSDAKEQKLSIPNALNLKHGCQLLPSIQHGTDGFYYCLLTKK